MRKLVVLVLVALGVLLIPAAASASTSSLGSPATLVAGTSPGLLAPSWATLADMTSPTVTAIDPVSGTNDIDTSVTISGSGFVATPTVSLGSTALTSVIWVNSTTLTATVPWGLNPGLYPLTVTNPDGGSGVLSSAFTVTAGIGQWNPGALFGGQMQQLFMKPGDLNTLYATAYGVIGLFRSTDAGEHWAFVSDKPWANNTDVAVDPLHPDWLYVLAPTGLLRSQDEGDTWTTLMDNKWPQPDGRDIQQYAQVYVSPYEDAAHPQALFVSSSCEGSAAGVTGPKGLIKSTDGGASWTIVPSLADVPVQDIAFDPNDHSHMVLVTWDMKVYKSSDWGDSWSQITTSGLTLSSLGLGGSITYNRGGSEVWIDAPAQQGDGGLFKSAGDLTRWQDVSPLSGYGSWFLTFASTSSVYVSRFHSPDGGTSWVPFGPSPWYGYGAFVFDPTDPQTAYITNDAVGVQKTTDLLGPTPTWQDKVEGLTALSCTSMATSPTDPLRVYAAFYGPLGIYRSLDGTSTWTFLPIAGASQLRRVLVDPFDPQRVYAGADSGFYTSTDGGDHWTGTGWHLPPSSSSGLLVDLAADPYQAGHLLACFGGYAVPRLLYSSTDYGASWQAIDVNLGVGEQWPHCIAFDPATPGTVYLAATGVYKSTDYGATWQRIDDPQQPGMATTGDITIAIHPQHVVAVEASGQLYRSVDGGATWQKAASTTAPGGVDVFVDGDSTRLYRATGQGLFFSSDVGDTWEPAAGVLGQVQTTALGYADADGHTILYAATNGGEAAATTTGMSAKTPQRAPATSSTLVDAGIYRYVQLPPTITGFSPVSGPVGTGVTLTGTGFSGATAVKFSGVAATYAVNNATQVGATVPAGATTGPITVSTPAGTVTSATNFTVIPAPTITSFSPASGPVGASVTLTGAGLTGASKVSFDGVAAKFTVNSDTKTTATVPAGASTGRITVTTPRGVAASAQRFTVLVTPKLTLKLSGLAHGVLKFGKRLTAKGTVKPITLVGRKVTLTVQLKRGGKWRKVRSLMCKIRPHGAYSGKYRPTKKGDYRLRATIAKTGTTVAITSKWLTFKVKI